MLTCLHGLPQIRTPTTNMTHPTPRLLYKYVDYPRRSILEDGLIRFTQPSAFNDPFEMHPSFDLMSKADIASLPKAPQQEGQPSSGRTLTPEVIASMLTTVMPGLQQAIADTVKGDGAYALNNNLIARSVLDAKFGVLSLTESPLNLLMWAHYADRHRGFVLQFDPAHEFFAPRTFEGQDLALTRVEYADERPVLSYTTLHSPSVLYRKSPSWSYEREWRLIRPLVEASCVRDGPRDSPYQLALFKIPLEAITGVIVGVNVSQVNQDELLGLLAKPMLKHIAVHHTRLSDDYYTLEVHPPIDGFSSDQQARTCHAR